MAPALVAVLAFLLYAIPYLILANGGRSAADAVASKLKETVTPADAVRVAIDVDPPIRAVGGEIDRITVDIASGTVAGALPVDAFALEASGIHFDTGAALFRREIVLKSPLEASASLTLTEQGLTEFLRSETLRERLRGIALPKGASLPGLGMQPRLDLLPMAATFDAGRIEVKGQVRVQGLGLVLPLSVSAQPVLVDPSHLTISEPRVLIMGRTLGAEQFSKVGGIPILDLDTIASGDLRIRVSTLDLSGGKLRVQANAIVNRIPPIGPQ